MHFVLMLNFDLFKIDSKNLNLKVNQNEPYSFNLYMFCSNFIKVFSYTFIMMI